RVTRTPDTAAPPADGWRRTRRREAVVLTIAAVATVGFGTAALLAPNDISDNSRSATATPSVPPIRPPADQVRPVHDALHDIDARCAGRPPPAVTRARSSGTPTGWSP